VNNSIIAVQDLHVIGAVVQDFCKLFACVLQKKSSYETAAAFV